MKYITRTIESVIKKAQKNFKVVMLTGMRQVGKSTMLDALSSDRGYVSLDQFQTLYLAKTDPESFFIKHPLPLTIDEIQRAPELMLEIKALVDARKTYGDVWLTGSQRFSMMKNVAESLAGRVATFEMLPLSLYERFGIAQDEVPYIPSSEQRVGCLRKKNADATWKLIFQGAWPKLMALDDSEREWYFEGLLHTYIESDIHRTLGIEKLEEYETFLRLLALRTGQELRIGTLAREVGVSEITVTRWLSVAEASGIVYFLRPFHENISKILVKSPKIYFIDTGLACYLSGLTSVEQLKTYYNRGALFETFVLSELLKSWIHNGKKPEFFFYRDSKGAEIDLLIRCGMTYHPVEIKVSERPTLSMVKAFDVLSKENVNYGAGSLITVAGPNEVLKKDVTTHSVWDI